LHEFPESAKGRLERRKEPRTPARGQIRLRTEDSLATAVTAALLDVSSSGFRARHDCHELATGATVSFVHGHTAGRARIMWTRILGNTVESGFLILP